MADTLLVRSCRDGMASIRANIVPMLLLWAMAVALVAAYYMVPLVAAALEPLQRWQTSSGKLAAFLNRAVFCGLIPGIFMALVPSVRPARPWLVIAAQIAWLGVVGILCDIMYSMNAQVFGTGVDFCTLLWKTLVSQFIWTPFVFAIPSAALCLWIGCDFSLARFLRDWPKRYFSRMYLPFLITNWAVWIPAMMAVHSFPTPLQIQLSGLVGAFWSLLGLELGRRASSSRTSNIRNDA